MIDNFTFNSVLVCDISVTSHFKICFCFMRVALLFVLFALCKCSIFISGLDFSIPVYFFCSYLIKHFQGQFRRHLSRYYHYGAFALVLLLSLSIMPVDSRTWYARIGVFQSTKIVTQSNSFQEDNLNFTALNIAFMYNEMSIKFFLVLFFLMWVLLKKNFDNFWSVIAKCTKGPLMSTHSASENVFTKQLIELLLMLSGDVEQNPSPEKEKSHITFYHWNLNGLMAHNFIKV